MSGKRIAGFVFLVLAVLFLFSGIRVITSGQGPSLTNSTGLGVSHAVGAMMPSMLMLIISLALLKKPKSSDRT